MKEVEAWLAFASQTTEQKRRLLSNSTKGTKIRPAADGYSDHQLLAEETIIRVKKIWHLPSPFKLVATPRLAKRLEINVSNKSILVCQEKWFKGIIANKLEPIPVSEEGEKNIKWIMGEAKELRNGVQRRHKKDNS